MWTSLFLAAALDARVAAVQKQYDQHDAHRLIPMLTEVLRFPTVQYDTEAREAQKRWLEKAARELGLEYRDAGLVAEVELPGPAGAPVLGLMVHGDVQPVDAAAWSFPPFEAKVAVLITGTQRGFFAAASWVAWLMVRELPEVTSASGP